MEAQDQDVLPAIGALGRGVSVEIVARSPWKWQGIARRVGGHFESRGWRVLAVEGDVTVETVPFFAIGLAGVGGSETRSPTLVTALQDLSDRFARQPGLIVLLDAGHLDPQSRGVVLHASRRWNVPILALRTLEPGGSGPVTAPGAHTYELAPASLAEFRSALESRLGSAIDHVAVTRIFTMTGGELDLALSLLESGLWSQTLERRGDVVTLGTWRWTSDYHRPAEAFLEHLDPPSRAALTALAVAGPIPVSSARDVVPDDLLSTLQAAHRLAIVEDGNEVYVVVRPPVVADHLRRTASPFTSAGIDPDQVVALSATRSAASARLAVVAPTAQVRAAQLINLAEDKCRRELLRAQQAWWHSPDLHAAVRLLRATMATSTVLDEQTSAAIDVLASAIPQPDLDQPGLDQPDLDQADLDHADLDQLDADIELQALRWTLHARDQGECTEAAARLRGLAVRATPAHRAYLLVRAARLEQAFELTADITVLVEAGSHEGLPAWINDSLWLTVAGTHLCRANPSAAVDALANVREAWDLDDELHALGCLVSVAIYRADEAALRRRLHQLQALAETSGTLLALQVSAAYHAAASLAGFTGPEFELPQELGLQLGLPLDRGPAGLLGATFTAASFSSFDTWLGFLVTTYDMGAGLESSSERCRLLVEGWARAHDLIAAGDLDAAAEHMAALGDQLRDLGAVLAAIQAYLVAGETASPDSGVLAHIQEGLSHLELEIVALYRDHPLPTSTDEGHFWRRLSETFERAGLNAAAARTWKRAISAHRRTGEEEARQDAEGRLDELLKIRWTREGALHTPNEQPLTEREREIAELIAAGLSNRDIATNLSLSNRTVEAHTHRILRKAGLSGRQEVAGYLLHHPGSARMRRITGRT